MIEEDAESADWIKTGTWDLIGVETVQQLLVAIGKPDGGKRAGCYGGRHVADGHRPDRRGR